MTQTAMTTEQREYTMRRLDEITSEKIAAKTKELFGEGNPNQPTWGMVFAAIKAGELTLKEGTEDSTRPYLNPQDAVWPAMEAKKQELADYREQLRVKRNAVQDELMLGSGNASKLDEFINA
jgi:hypothetical protein